MREFPGDREPASYGVLRSRATADADPESQVAVEREREITGHFARTCVARGYVALLVVI